MGAQRENSKVPLRFRTQELAQAAADQLHAEQRKK